MGLFGSIKKRFIIQLVSIVLLEDSCKIYVKKLKNSRVIFRAKKSFEIESKDKLSQEVISYLTDLQEEHEQTYIALFLNTLGQGAIPGCKSGDFDKYSVDKKNVRSICIDKEFTIYASLIDIGWIDKIFKSVGLDYIYSPFLVLNHFANKEELENEVKLYILNTHNGLTIMIKEGKKLLYGSFFNTAKDDDLLNDDFEEVDAGEDMEIDLEIDDDEFEIFDDDENELDDDETDSVDEFDFESLGDAMTAQDNRLVKYLDISLQEFYRSELYDSTFISKVKIYDDSGMQEKVISHIEDELLLDTSAENIDILEVILEISEKEVFSNA